MQGTLVFVHGTGVRSPGLDERWSVLTSSATAHGFDAVRFERVDWGNEVGAPLDNLGISLPVPQAPDVDLVQDPDSAAAWELLMEDPLFELRLIADSPRRGPEVVGQDVAADAVANLDRLGGFAADNGELLARAGISAAELAAATAFVADAPEYGSAAEVVGRATDADLTHSAARAIVARALEVRRSGPIGSQPEAAFDKVLRSELVAEVASTLSPLEERGIGDWVKKKVARFAAARVTAVATGRRQEIMGAASPFMADILHYQRRGELVREFVASRLADQEPPVVAVGHSLGGVVLVDLLTGDGAPPVDLLVTVGSQAPFFYSIDALQSLRRDQPGNPFTPWVNVYDSNDLLSFCAERVFPGVDLIADVEVSSGVPFPEAHSAYFEQPGLWETIAAAWPA